MHRLVLNCHRHHTISAGALLQHSGIDLRDLPHTYRYLIPQWCPLDRCVHKDAFGPDGKQNDLVKKDPETAQDIVENRALFLLDQVST